jgi:hypothetical protein
MEHEKEINDLKEALEKTLEEYVRQIVLGRFEEAINISGSALNLTACISNLSRAREEGTTYE